MIEIITVFKTVGIDHSPNYPKNNYYKYKFKSLLVLLKTKFVSLTQGL